MIRKSRIKLRYKLSQMIFITAFAGRHLDFGYDVLTPGQICRHCYIYRNRRSIVLSVYINFSFLLNTCLFTPEKGLNSQVVDGILAVGEIALQT
jgi:hypothetical protein